MELSQEAENTLSRGGKVWKRKAQRGSPVRGVTSQEDGNETKWWAQLEDSLHRVVWSEAWDVAALNMLDLGRPIAETKDKSSARL